MNILSIHSYRTGVKERYLNTILDRGSVLTALSAWQYRIFITFLFEMGLEYQLQLERE